MLLIGRIENIASLGCPVNPPGADFDSEFFRSRELRKVHGERETLDIILSALRIARERRARDIYWCVAFTVIARAVIRI